MATVAHTSDLSLALRQTESPLRVDFAGGWLDCPQFARPGAYIVNCAISPLVTLKQLEESHRIGTGLGASAARWLLLGIDPVTEELAMGVGWQDPAVFVATGLCVWRSGSCPVLDSQTDPRQLNLEGTMALLWTGVRERSSASIGRGPRNLDLIKDAGLIARDAVLQHVQSMLHDAVRLSYQAQLTEGMAGLPDHGEQAKKYCGAGFGGMALYCFEVEKDRNHFLETVKETQAIEPYFRSLYGAGNFRQQDRDFFSRITHQPGPPLVPISARPSHKLTT